LDGKSEALIHDHLREFIRSRTTILITHRAQSLQLADRVLVMEAGKVVVDCPRDEAAGRSLEFQGLFARSA
jgi:ABC-type bacteriocin/lantibiotic exporter with double-glycine peptidase domain